MLLHTEERRVRSIASSHCITFPQRGGGRDTHPPRSCVGELVLHRALVCVRVCVHACVWPVSGLCTHTHLKSFTGGTDSF